MTPDQAVADLQTPSHRPGVGLLVTPLIRVQRKKQRLLAFGLSEHYRQIFELTRLNETIGISSTEAEALATATA